ncbi:MAG: isocitrate/isopropylmalate dehydrogenase family protein [Candidatus Brocadiia bacterium]
MAKYRIAWLPGDGVGVEVMNATRLVLDKLAIPAEYIHGDIGWECWRHGGNAFPQATIDLIKSTDCALFGAITSKPKEEAEKELDPQLKGKGLSYFSPIVGMRQMFDLYVNMRPCKAYPSNPLNYKENIDIVVFRENTEGLYSGVEFFPFGGEVRKAIEAGHPKMKPFKDIAPDKIAVSLRIITEKGASRIIRAAFEFARKNHRKAVCVVEKPNVIRETSGLFVREGRKIAAEYPEIKLQEANIDAMCMWLLKNPFDYDVIVTSNLFGDILSDLVAQMVGGLGFASAGNIGANCAVFEPTHGSAPKYAGQDKVNPIACILAAGMMLDWLGEKDKALAIDAAVAKVIREGKVRTYDMGGTAKLSEMAAAIAAKL